MGRLNNPLACFILQPTGHPKATHQWLLMGVQACRLPALKTLQTLKTIKNLKTLKTLTWHASSCSQPYGPQGHTSIASYGRPSRRLPALKPLKPSKRLKPFKRLKPLKRLLGMLHLAANGHPKATHQWLLMGRLNNCHASSCSQQAPQGHTSIASYGRPSLPFASP